MPKSAFERKYLTTIEACHSHPGNYRYLTLRDTGKSYSLCLLEIQPARTERSTVDLKPLRMRKVEKLRVLTRIKKSSLICLFSSHTVSSYPEDLLKMIREHALEEQAVITKHAKSQTVSKEKKRKGAPLRRVRTYQS
jgi:hypothetical protein